MSLHARFTVSGITGMVALAAVGRVRGVVGDADIVAEIGRRATVIDAAVAAVAADIARIAAGVAAERVRAGIAIATLRAAMFVAEAVVVGATRIGRDALAIANLLGRSATEPRVEVIHTAGAASLVDAWGAARAGRTAGALVDACPVTVLRA